jgi:hypothetical protein
VTSYALPWMITQQDSLLLCFAISSPLSWLDCLLLLSRFMAAMLWLKLQSCCSPMVMIQGS